MKFATCVALLCGVGILSGCNNVSNQLLGVPPALQQSNLVAEEQLQEAMVGSLIRKSGLPPGSDLSPGSPNWKYVTLAGLVEVDIQCDRYLAALFSFNREQRAGRQILTAAGAGTAAIMGLTGAPGVSIALVAAAFGLAATVFDAGVNSVLFTISPAAVRAVAARGRQVYITGIKWETVTSRPVMMGVVHTYLSQCTPAAIEANIDYVATGAPSVASSDTDIALKSAASGAPSSSVVLDPKLWGVRPVSREASPYVPPILDPALNALSSETPYIRTRAEAQALQRALGVTADGDLGVKPSSVTRAALAEFQTGQYRRNLEDATGTGVIDGNTYEKVNRIPAMPTIFKSAFERGLLSVGPNYTQLDPRAIENTIRRLGGAAQVSAKTPEEALQRMTVLRTTITASRTNDGNKEPALADVLDAALYDAHKPKQ